MNLQLTYQDQSYKIDTTKFTDLSLPLEHQGGVRAFHLPKPQFLPFEAGSFIGSVQKGGPCNCATLTLSPHGNGTHTESVGHISKEPVYIHDVLKPGLKWALLITALPDIQENGDRIVGLKSLPDSLPELPEAIMLRTFRKPQNPEHDYSGTNPTYLAPELCKWLAEKCVEHLIVDQPSVDREEDGGSLASHHAFWQYPEHTRLNATITELANFPESLNDGLYALELQIAPLLSDASPSRPILFTPQPIER